MSDSLLPDEGEHLTDGWEPETPPDDTLKRRAVLVHASWPVAVASALGRPSRRTDRWSGAHVGDSGDLTNPVVLTRPVREPDAASLVAEIAEVIPSTSSYFLLNPWPGPDLAPHGLALLGHPPLMVRFPGPRPDHDPQDVRVTEVRDEAELAAAERVLIASDDGRPTYERMGYLPLERWTTAWLRPART